MMANFHQPQVPNFFRQSHLNLDTHKYYDDEDEGVLDDNILDQHSGLDSALDMSPSMDASRRESYAVSTSNIFSPKTQEWQHMDIQSSASSNHQFGEQNSNPFMNTQNSTVFGQQTQWGMEGPAGSHTPMQAYDGLPGEFDNNNNNNNNGNAPVSFRSMQGQTPFSNTGNQVQLFSPSNTTAASIPNSPSKDWALAADSMDHRAMPKRMRQNSPGLRSHSPLMRRDGIRKKNARFDIPAERNLQNIDHLIAESIDEQEIKELKQQKRLLRNRQAALDSRQRKKMHTERLEDEKKQYTNIIQDLETELIDSKQRVQELLYQLERYESHTSQLLMEKEELVRNHTQETSDLRKKVNVLTDSVHRLESTAMSAVPSSGGFALSDFDSLTMDTWDFFGQDNEVKPEPLAAKKMETSTALINDSDKSSAQGILLMILLFGAYVATNSQAPGIPRMSDDVRAASATILEDVYKDSGVSNNAASTTISTSAPIQSINANNDNIWSSTAPSHVHPNDLSVFGSYADSLSMPTEEQKHEQLFGLSAAQYNSVSSPSFLHNLPEPSGEVSQGRRNIAEALEAMRRKEKDKSAADVYSRSLLWDQIPSDVVRSFAKLVEEQNSGGA